MTETPAAANTPADRAEPRLFKFLRAMSKELASDLHLKAGSPPHIRLQTRIIPTQHPALTNEDLTAMVDEVFDDRQRQQFAAIGSVDLAVELPGADRFRINAFRQRGQISLAVRRVSRKIPTFEQLHLPPQLAGIAEEHAGLVLVAGVTGAGKSTTIAAMLEHINQTRACHIVTIEDPIEYLYVDKKSLVNQREVGIDVPDFETALKFLMREDPDVVLIGEMRDRDTFQAALQAAETGHLVFGTIHASMASSTVARILDLFPPESRDLARQSLVFNLRAIVCQRLLPCLDAKIGRVPAVEILLMNAPVRLAIEEGRDADLNEVIRSCEEQGMQDMTQSLLDLIEKEFIDPRSAYEVAPNPEELKMRMKGISASRAGLMGR